MAFIKDCLKLEKTLEWEKDPIKLGLYLHGGAIPMLEIQREAGLLKKGKYFANLTSYFKWKTNQSKDASILEKFNMTAKDMAMELFQRKIRNTICKPSTRGYHTEAAQQDQVSKR